jgi:hypothetical protein
MIRAARAFGAPGRSTPFSRSSSARSTRVWVDGIDGSPFRFGSEATGLPVDSPPGRSLGLGRRHQNFNVGSHRRDCRAGAERLAHGCYLPEGPSLNWTHCAERPVDEQDATFAHAKRRELIRDNVLRQFASLRLARFERCHRNSKGSTETVSLRARSPNVDLECWIPGIL